MNYSEAKEKINKIKESTQDFQTSINKVQAELVSKMSDLNTINSSIKREIKQDNIVSYSNTDIDSINDSINEALSLSANALSTLSRDATEEIKRIVDSYNNSIEYDEEGKPKSPRLSYETISLSSIAGLSGGNPNRSGGGGYYGDNPPSTPTSFSDVISRLGSENINSDEIDNWNLYVSDFLNTYGLSDSVESISIEGGKIICKLKNGQTITFENVTDINELVAKIKSNL